MIIRKATTLLTVICMIACLSSCALYDKEYVAVNDYVISSPDLSKNEGRITTANLSELKRAVENAVEMGEKEVNIIFPENYSGDVSQDLAEACWQVRSQNALCAYCVDNISYELSKIVNYYEATLSVSYADTGVPFDKIYQMQYATGISDLIKKTMESGEKKLVILIKNSSYTAESIASMVSDIYLKNPISLPKEPSVNIQLYGGTGNQKLYNMTFNYGMSDEKLILEKEELSFINPFNDVYETDNEKFKAVAEYIRGNIAIGDDSTIYSALVNGEGNSKALALSTVALCNKIGLDSAVVEGQKNYNDRLWNLIKIDGSYYHFDPYDFLESDTDRIYLKSDSDMWNSYRWDTSSYPKCSLSLTID